MNEQLAVVKYFQSKQWEFKESGNEQIELDECPYCHKTGYGHFYIRAIDNSDTRFVCHRCGKQGNLRTLKEDQGDYTHNASRGPEPEIDADELHNALMENHLALEYCLNRGWSEEIIERQRLGYTTKYFRKCGAEVPALVYPYFDADGNLSYWHYRSLPPADKDFISPFGWDAQLYNGHIIKNDVKEIILVEGEANVLTAMTHGIENVVGVPGANFKKIVWLEELDRIQPDIYILYDKDSVGQKAAEALASRIGIERCHKIVLPDFMVKDKPGKDLNEWFVHGGGNLEAFEKLKQSAKLFDVMGTVNTMDAIVAVEDSVSNKTSLTPTYTPPWPNLAKKVGFENGDVIDVIAKEKIGKTTFAMNMMEYMTDFYEENGVIICLEMSVVRMARKWIAHVTGFEEQLEDKTGEQLIKFKQAIGQAKQRIANREANLYFCSPPHVTDVQDALDVMINCIRRYDVKWIMFDNLQLLCDSTLKDRNRTVYLSQISKSFSKLAKDYDIKMIRIIQPHRVKDGQIVTTNNIDGASQIAKDCDCAMVLHREAYDPPKKFDGWIDEDNPAFKPELYVNVGLSRYSSGGQIALKFDGPRSTVSEQYAEFHKVPTTDAESGHAKIRESIMETTIKNNV